jgi:hypothetical protein
MSRCVRVLAVVAVCAMAVGCVPIREKAVVHYGVRGRLLDASTGEPVAKTRVSVLVDGRNFDRKTSGRGEFKVSPEMHHFWTWLGGPVWMNATGANVEIALEGYSAYRKAFVVRSPSPDVPVPPDQDRLDGSYIALRDIEMKKREQDGAANRSQPFRIQTNRASLAAGSDR